jgi:hypothetical protein
MKACNDGQTPAATRVFVVLRFCMSECVARVGVLATVLRLHELRPLSDARATVMDVKSLAFVDTTEYVKTHCGVEHSRRYWRLNEEVEAMRKQK